MKQVRLSSFGKCESWFPESWFFRGSEKWFLLGKLTNISQLISARVGTQTQVCLTPKSTLFLIPQWWGIEKAPNYTSHDSSPPTSRAGPVSGWPTTEAWFEESCLVLCPWLLRGLEFYHCRSRLEALNTSWSTSIFLSSFWKSCKRIYIDRKWKKDTQRVQSDCLFKALLNIVNDF